MELSFGREVCCDIEQREWLLTNGLGSYASGTITGQVSRGYHGLLVAALQPPLGRTVLLSKLDETCCYDNQSYALSANQWADRVIELVGQVNLECFYLDGTMPVWHYACADALLEKRVWLQPGAQRTYIRYTLLRASLPLDLSVKALVNYRDHHGRTRTGNLTLHLSPTAQGVQILADLGTFYIYTDRGRVTLINQWYHNFLLLAEQERGLEALDDNLYAATFDITLEAGESITLVASIDPLTDLDSESALANQQAHETALLRAWHTAQPMAKIAPQWIQQLVLAADQFVVNRNLGDQANEGKSIIAGYHWFGDWGRDTMIALPGLTLTTGRYEIARLILDTFALYVSQGMLPNRFADHGTTPDDSEYNTVDATLWYFEAIRQYNLVTGDDQLLSELFPILAEIINWHLRGTRYNIKVDQQDGLLFAGQSGVQLTWMDAKVDNWVVTPRIGKPIEINALWYNALHSMISFAKRLGQPTQIYRELAAQTLCGLQRFWNEELGYCYDVLDTPEGNDISLRPNQIFAVSLAQSPLSTRQQRAVVDACSRALLTSYGLRSLDPSDPRYQGHYGGSPLERDSAYHQGTVWSWLIGPFALAHLRVYNNREQAASFLAPLAQHLRTAGLGTISEIFEGDAPFKPKGCIAQAWSVAEVLRVWHIIRNPSQ